MTRPYPLPALVSVWVLGIGLFQQLSRLPAWPTFAAILFLGVVLGWKRQWLGCAFLAGWLWAGVFAVWQLSHNTLPNSLEGKELEVQGVITSLPKADARKTRFDFKVTNSDTALPGKLILSWYHPKVPLYAGQHWAFTVKLKKPHGLANPGGFDYERWLFIQGVGATGYVRHPETAQLLSQDSPWQSVTVIRQRLAERITQLAGLRYSAFIKALTLGDKEAITAAQWQVLQKTGTVHLMAISGAHIGLIAGLVYWLTRRLWTRLPLLRVAPQQAAAIAAFASGALYALLAGFAVPTQRALIMLSVVMLGIVWQRHIRPLQTLSVAMLGILLYDPLAVLSPGFWLSFTAVALIFYVRAGRLASSGYWRGILKIQGIMVLGMAPLLLGYFQQLSLIAPVANLIAVPVVCLLIVPVALIAVLLMGFAPALSMVLLQGADLCLEHLWWLLTTLASWPWAVYTRSAASLLALCLASIGIVVLSMPKGLPGRWLGGVLCLPLVFSTPNALPPGTVRMTLLDVGQGLATVVQTAGHVLVFDTGIKFSEQADSGQQVLLPFLATQGIQKIDAVVISHGDNDHIGGAVSLLAQFPPTWLYTGVPAQLAGYAPRRCQQGQRWNWDGVEFVMLAPKSGGFDSDNNNSCVLHIRTPTGSLLLTGDIEKKAEAWLVKTYAQHLHAEVLVAPHHGSNTSSTAAFIQQVDPSLILIPAGYRNPFHFPHPKVLKRYHAQHKTWLTVAEHGAVQVDITSTGIDTLTFRATTARYWHTYAVPEQPVSFKPFEE